ncbi:hypothetical protein MAR_004663 [Mya arenaria]|uniref:Uncharacterized protein n=1 Tax=Mya arenaria TaxID=6604 RepID=A0ABY7F1D5_MYAAR|nr:hypothetical protein MAR_004663 [Mya arenaria]
MEKNHPVRNDQASTSWLTGVKEASTNWFFASTCVKPTGQEQDTVKPEHDLHLFIDDHITFPDSAERMKQNPTNSSRTKWGDNGTRFILSKTY